MAEIEGLNNVLKNIDKAQEAILKVTEIGMDVEVRKTANYIKTEYSRPKTGKGFTDQSSNLRNSIGGSKERRRNDVLGWVHAGEPYAPHVELRYDGMYAYLWPGVKDRAKDIKSGIAKLIRLVTG